MCSMFVMFKHTLIYIHMYYDTSSYIILIHFLYPLTKESVSTNNHNGHNYGGMAKSQSLMMTATRLRSLMKMKEESGGDY